MFLERRLARFVFIIFLPLSQLNQSSRVPGPVLLKIILVFSIFYQLFYLFTCSVRLVEMLRAEKRPAVSHVMSILTQARKLFEKQPNILRITVPDGQRITVVVCFQSDNLLITLLQGDTHGQFYDLLHIFEVNGYPSLKNPYIINGDFVDRGSFGVEVRPDCFYVSTFIYIFPLL